MGGFLVYYEIMQALNNDTLPWLPGATPKSWETVVDGCYLAPYITNGQWWVGYDDVDSIRLKAQFVNSRGLAGSMVWSIESDDFRADYGPKYPLISEIKRVMNSGRHCSQSSTSTMEIFAKQLLSVDSEQKSYLV